MKKIIFLLIVCLFLAGENVRAGVWDATFLFDTTTIKKNWQEKWDEEEKDVFYWYLGLQATDTITTINLLTRHKGRARELNPIFGKNPSVKRILIQKLLANWLFFSIWNDCFERDERKEFFQVVNTICTLVVANNLIITIKVEFE
ncbi:hypothetical protein KKD19_02125 [Patescibacteria group bacterium]|nr:hypothetical protein [Patescibacteria group bacterium]MBU4512022.1 hypothetical protein [Patescibacteria group bacterium]MCG2693201.1 hypothetical protein [Candidatus Parcubacteria bacterium]